MILGIFYCRNSSQKALLPSSFHPPPTLFHQILHSPDLTTCSRHTLNFIKTSLSWAVAVSYYLNTPKRAIHKNSNQDRESQRIDKGSRKNAVVKIVHSRRCVHVRNMDIFQCSQLNKQMLYTSNLKYLLNLQHIKQILDPAEC